MKKKQYLLLFAIMVILSFCSNCKNDSQEVSMINELQECESENIHYKILKNHTNNRDSILGKIVLPILSSSINTKKNTEILWPEVTKYRIVVRAKGRYSNKNKPHDSYGCQDAHEFRIDTIISITNVTKEMDFRISDKIVCGIDTTVEPERIFIKIDTVSDPINDFWRSISEEDCRFVGIMGYALDVPNVDNYYEKYSKTNGVKVIEGTGDDRRRKGHFGFQKFAKEYAITYNLLLLKYMEDEK